MKRVLQLVTRDEPGGVQVLTQMVQAGLIGRGYRVETLILRGGEHSLRRVIRTILGDRPDAILSYHVAAGLSGSLIGRLAGTPIRVTHLTAVPSAMHPWWRFMDRLWGQLGLHTGIIANSAATAEAVAHYPSAYRARVKPIPHGVPRLPPPNDLDWRKRLGLPPDVRLLVASGRLAPQKDHATAVAALSALPDAHLAIAGEGPLHAALVELARRNGSAARLHLVGNLDRSALAGLLASADVCLFPSVWESFGLAAVEAALLGVPVLAADLPVLREVLAAPARHDMARFHAPGDAEDLAHRLAPMLQAPPDAQRRALSAADTAAAHSVDQMLDSYCRLIDPTS